MENQHVQLSKGDREYLEELVSKGTTSARIFKRARALLDLNRGKTVQAVADALGVVRLTVTTWRNRYRERGLACLEDEPRSGRPPTIDGKSRAKITALACSKPPKGHARWDLRLLAEKVVELGYCDQISHTHVGRILKKTT